MTRRFPLNDRHAACQQLCTLMLHEQHDINSQRSKLPNTKLSCIECDHPHNPFSTWRLSEKTNGTPYRCMYMLKAACYISLQATYETVMLANGSANIRLPDELPCVHMLHVPKQTPKLAVTGPYPRLTLQCHEILNVHYPCG